MDKRIDKKKFKEPKNYILSVILYTFLCIIIVIIYLYIKSCSEVEIIDYYESLNLIGDAKQRSSLLLQKIIVKYFGKRGLIFLISLLFFMLLNMLYSEISAYRRYKHKCKLYHEGVIKNFFDIYDDGPSYSLLGGVKKLFRKNKIKYPSKKKLKQTEKEMEDYFKDKQGE